MVTVYGVVALTFMMTDDVRARGSRPVVRAGLRARLRLVEQLRVVSGAWPFGVVEGVWTLVALRRFSVRFA